MVSSLLQLALEAKRNGDFDGARLLLLRVVDADADNEHAWFHLSEVAASPDQALGCLEQVIRINPRNVLVRARAAELRRRVGGAEPEAAPGPVAAPEANAAPAAEPGAPGSLLSGGSAPTASGRGPIPFLGEYLVRCCGLKPEDLERALAYQRELAAEGRPALLGKLLVNMGLAREDQVEEALGQQLESLSSR